MERLQKVIANLGYCSRRHAEELIISNKVKVNGEIVNELGSKVKKGDTIEVEGNILDNNATYCFLCGNTDLEPINNNINNASVLNNDYNNVDIYNDNISNDIIDNPDDVNKNMKSKIFKFYIIFSHLLLIISIFIGIFTLKNSTHNYKPILPEEMKNYMNEEGFILTDMTDTYGYLDTIDNYYSFKKGNISIIYLDVNGKNSVYDTYKNNISHYEDYAITKEEVNEDDINKYVLKTRTKYGYVVRVEDKIIYTLTDSKYSDYVYGVFDELGYGKINYKLFYICFGISIANLLILGIMSIWKIFVKTGRKGIISLIPIYNLYLLSKIIIGNGWLFILIFIPIIGLLYYLYFSYKLGKLFGKDIKFILGLMFLGSLFIPILSYDNSDYLGIKKI